MDAGSTIAALSLVVLFVLNGLIAASHTALMNARKPQLRELAELGDKRAQRVLDMTEDEPRLILARQIAAIILRFVAAGLITVAVAQPLAQTLSLYRGEGSLAEVAQVLVYPATWVIGALVMMFLSDLIPSAFASTRPERLAMVTAGPMAVLMKLLVPLSRFMQWLNSGLVTRFGGRGNVPAVTEEEIKTLVDAGSEEGVIEDEEKEMIYSIFQFGDKVAREIMVPRIDIKALEAETPVGGALDLVLAEGHSRIPIYEGSIDKICGLLYAKDLLVVWHDNQGKDRKVREIMRPAYFVPESKKAGSLLEDLQQRKIHMAIVIDEYGGTAGIVTIEDLLEEIVGDIQDEYDPDEEAEYEKISEDEYLFDAAINLNDVNDLLDVHVPDEESDTLGGYVLSALGRVPLAGEVFQAEMTDSPGKRLEIKVETVTGRRIRKVRVRRLPPPITPEEAAAEADSTADNGAKSESHPVEVTSNNSVNADTA